MQFLRPQIGSRRIRRPERRRFGAATVETALVLPLFLLVLMGIVEIGRALMVAQLLNNAAREGSRAAVMTGSTNTEVTTTVQNVVQSLIGVAPADVTVEITVTEYAGNPSTGNNVANANKRDMCQVAVSVPFNKVNWIPMNWLSNQSLSGQSAMRHE